MTLSLLQKESARRKRPVAPKARNKRAVTMLLWPCPLNSQNKSHSIPIAVNTQNGDNKSGVAGILFGEKMTFFSAVNFSEPFSALSTARSRSAGRKQASRGLATLSTLAPSNNDNP